MNGEESVRQLKLLYLLSFRAVLKSHWLLCMLHALVITIPSLRKVWEEEFLLAPYRLASILHLRVWWLRFERSQEHKHQSLCSLQISHRRNSLNCWWTVSHCIGITTSLVSPALMHDILMQPLKPLQGFTSQRCLTDNKGTSAFEEIFSWTVNC